MTDWRRSPNANLCIRCGVVDSVDGSKNEAVALRYLGAIADCGGVGNAGRSIRGGTEVAVVVLDGVGPAGVLPKEGVVVARCIVIAGILPEK